MAGQTCFSALRLCLLLLASTALVQAKVSVELARVKVIYPPNERKTFDMGLADFGADKYGGTLKGQLIYPSAKAGYKCEPEACEYGCRPFNASMPPLSLDKSSGVAYIMLLDRGPRLERHYPCYFIEKAYHAQLAGADAVLIASDVDDGFNTPIAPDDSESARMVELLSISAAIITKADGTFLKNLLTKGDVTLQLSWEAVLPQNSTVEWEFWSNTNDQCGPSCDDQLNFVRDMRSYAPSLEAAGQLSFSPHYMLWSCPDGFKNTTECHNECIMDGRYCIPDPDDDVREGYMGRDVLMMNMRSLCFFKLAQSAGKASLWWDYISMFGTNCTMASSSFGLECATRVFDSLGGKDLAADGKGVEWWDKCAEFNETDALARQAAGDVNATQIPLLEEEIMLQRGGGERAAVTIMPTVRINGGQYRGSLRAGDVMRALCSAFISGRQPSVCNQAWVSDDECKPGGIGDIACQTKDANNVCINTFAGYTCQCKEGWVRATNPDTGEDRCEDINECLATNIGLENPLCSCERCACINSIGGYTCTGAMPNQCTKENEYGGCWVDTKRTGPKGEAITACKDTFRDFARLAARGLANSSYPTYTCQCPGCYTPTKDGKGCEPLCDLKDCNFAAGICMSSGSGGGGGGSTASAGGVSGLTMFLVVVLAVVVTGGGFLLANKYLLKQRMTTEIREIMSQYMPLDERRNRAKAGGAPVGPGTRNGGGGLLAADEDDEEDHLGWPGSQAGSYGWGGPAAAPGTSSSGAGAGGGQQASKASEGVALLAASKKAGPWGPAAGASETTNGKGQQFALPPTTAVVSASAGGAPAPAPAAASPFLPLASDQAAGGSTAAAAAPGAAASDAGILPGVASDPLLGQTLLDMGNAIAPGAAPSADQRDANK